MRKLYLFLAVVGFAVPYYFFVSFLLANGLDLQLLFSQLFANDISTFFAADLIITAIVFWAFLYRTARRCQMGNWWVYIVATLAVDPSSALPLFLYFREAQIEALRKDIHIPVRGLGLLLELRWTPNINPLTHRRVANPPYDKE